MTTTSTLDPKLRNRITRYLHTGNEVPKYFPGCWTNHKYFESDKLKAIDEALVNEPNNVEIVNIILKAYQDGWYTRFETIAFALTKCLVNGSAVVKEATYKAASQICNSPEEMMLFNKFTRLLQTGNGRGWCRHVKEWYTTKDPMDLVKEITRVRARHGRSHKTLLRKSHVKVAENDHARDAVIKYAIFGFKQAKQLLGNVEEAQAVLEYIQKVEDLRHCEDPVAAGEMATLHQFTLDHVPGHLLTSQEVWNAILPQFSLSELLSNIQRIHNMGYLTSDSTTTAILISLLSNPDFIKKSKVTPIEVYIALCNYKKKTRPLKFEKAKVALEKQTRRRARQIFDTTTELWEWNITRRHPREIKYWGIDQPSNTDVIAALYNLMDQTWLLTPPTNCRYLITLDMRHHMFKGRHFCKSYTVPKKGKKASDQSTPAEGGEAETEKRESKKHLLAECFYNKHVTPGHAAIILALQLLKREKNAKLAVFSEDGIQLVTIERNFSNIEEAEFVLRKSNLGRVQLDAPIVWATKMNQKFDVFINMVDRSTRYMELDQTARGGRGPGGRFGPPPNDNAIADRCPARAIDRYRKSFVHEANRNKESLITGEIEDRCPVRALEQYRKELVGDAKLIVLSLASHRVATTDGSHEGILDIVGVDEHVPKVMDAFVLGQFM